MTKKCEVCLERPALPHHDLCDECEAENQELAEARVHQLGRYAEYPEYDQMDYWWNANPPSYGS